MRMAQSLHAVREECSQLVWFRLLAHCGFSFPYLLAFLVTGFFLSSSGLVWLHLRFGPCLLPRFLLEDQIFNLLHACSTARALRNAESLESWIFLTLVLTFAVAFLALLNLFDRRVRKPMFCADPSQFRMRDSLRDCSRGSRGDGFGRQTDFCGRHLLSPRRSPV